MFSDWKYPVGAGVGAAIMLAGCLLWYEGIPLLLDGRVDHVRHEASAGMVSKAELAAAEAEAGELRRQVMIGRRAAENYAAELARTKAAQAQAEEQLEQKDRDYEAQLTAAGRSCSLSDDDVRFLRR